MGLHGKIKLSPKVLKHCQCDGKSPFMILDAKTGEPTWCPCYPFRMRKKHIDKYIRQSGIPAPFRFKFLQDFKEEYDNGEPIPGVGMAQSLFYHHTR